MEKKQKLWTTCENELLVEGPAMQFKQYFLVRNMCPLPSHSAGTLSGKLEPVKVLCTISVRRCVHQSCCVWKTVSLVFYIPLSVSVFLPPLLPSFLRPEKRGLKKISYLEVSVSKSLSLSVCFPVMGICVSFIYCRRKL